MERWRKRGILGNITVGKCLALYLLGRTIGSGNSLKLLEQEKGVSQHILTGGVVCFARRRIWLTLAALFMESLVAIQAWLTVDVCQMARAICILRGSVPGRVDSWAFVR